MSCKMTANKILILSFNIWGVFHLFLWKRLQYILWLTDKKELFELVIWLLDVKDCRKGFWEVLCFYGVKVIMCDCIYHSATEGGKKTEFVNVKVTIDSQNKTILHFYFLFAVEDTMLHDHFICCGHHVTWPKHKKVILVHADEHY